MSSSQKSKKTERYTLISFVEPVIDANRSSIPGAIYFLKSETRYYLRFMFYGNGKTQCIGSIFQMSEPLNFNGFKDGDFEVDCRLIDYIQFTILEKGIQLTLFCRGVAERRKFIFKNIFNQLTEFIMQLSLAGVVVPMICNDRSYGLQFYEECSPNQFLHCIVNTQPERRSFDNFNQFWSEFVKFSEKYICSLFKENPLSHNPRYPLTSAALTDLQIFMDSISDCINQKMEYEIIKAEEFPQLFDENGKMKDPDSFKKRAFYCGIDEKALPEALPYLFSMYPLDSTKESREKQDKELNEEFNQLLQQVNLIKPKQLKHNRKLKENSFDIIVNDALRTDRDGVHGAFKLEFKTGMNTLMTLLRVYCLFNQNIGYVQGMNDLFVPIMLTYMPKWNEEGEPVDENGNIIDPNKYIPKMFWIYDAMLRNVGHDIFLTSLTDNSVKIAKKVMHITKQIAPLVVVWMKSRKINALLFMYHDFIYLYKRSFSHEVWNIWLQFHCSPDPKHWIVYFVTAILLKTFPIFANLPNVPNDQWLPKMMDSFPAQLQTCDIRELGRLALWLSQNYPITDEVDDSPSDYNYEYFDVDCLKDLKEMVSQ